MSASELNYMVYALLMEKISGMLQIKSSLAKKTLATIFLAS